jgi:hypothetical protein
MSRLRRPVAAVAMVAGAAQERCVGTAFNKKGRTGRVNRPAKASSGSRWNRAVGRPRGLFEETADA